MLKRRSVIFEKLLDLGLWIYKVLVGPILHGFGSVFFGAPTGCRFTPSCSEFMVSSMKQYGFIQGGLRGLRRLGRCHPFSKAVY